MGLALGSYFPGHKKCNHEKFMIMAVQDMDVQATLRQEMRANFGRIFEIRHCSTRALGNLPSAEERILMLLWGDIHGSLKWSRMRYYLCGNPYLWSERDEKWLPCQYS